MELRHLRYFVAVADELNVTRAASRLNVAQPALSHQIKNLEREVGAPLFARLSRGVALTAPGTRFAEDARAILAAVHAASERARRAAAGEVGRICIGFTGSASFHPSVTGAIRDYRTAYPDVHVDLVEEPTTDLLAGLKAGRVDAAFVRPAPGEVDAFWSRHLLDEPMVVAAPAGHPVAGRGTVALAELAGEAFILYPRRNGRGLHDRIMAACEAAGFTPRVAQDAPQLTSVVNLVATGIALSIVPASMDRLATEGVTYLRIQENAPTAPMALARPRTRDNPAGEAFAAVASARFGGGFRPGQAAGQVR